MPAMDDLDGSEYEEMGKHLLVAADRYSMESMRKSILVKVEKVFGKLVGVLLRTR